MQTNYIKRIPFAAVPVENGADGSEIEMVFPENYYQLEEVFKIDGSGIGTAGNSTAKFVDDRYSRAFNSYTERVPGTSRVSINIDGEVYDRFIPKEIEDYFDTEFDFRSVANWKMLTNLATAYFTMLATPNISVSGGGSTGNDQKWGRDPREDEMEWAHRCAQAAIAALGKRARYGRRR